MGSWEIGLRQVGLAGQTGQIQAPPFTDLTLGCSLHFWGLRPL